MKRIAREREMALNAARTMHQPTESTVNENLTVTVRNISDTVMTIDSELPDLAKTNGFFSDKAIGLTVLIAIEIERLHHVLGDTQLELQTWKEKYAAGPQNNQTAFEGEGNPLMGRRRQGNNGMSGQFRVSSDHLVEQENEVVGNESFILREMNGNHIHAARQVAGPKDLEGKINDLIMEKERLLQERNSLQARIHDIGDNSYPVPLAVQHATNLSGTDKKDGKREDLEQKMSRMLKEKVEWARLLEEKVKEVEVARVEANVLKTKFMELESQMTSLVEENENLTQMLNEKQQEFENYAVDVVKLQKEWREELETWQRKAANSETSGKHVSTLEKQRDILIKETENMTTLYKEKQREVDTWRNKFLALESEFQKLEAGIHVPVLKKLEPQRLNSEREVSFNVNSASSNDKEREKYFTENEQLKSELQKLMTKCAFMESQTKKLAFERDEMIQYKAELEHVKEHLSLKDFDGLRTENKQLHERINSLLFEIEEWKAKEMTWQDEIELASKDVVKKVQRENAALQNEVFELRQVSERIKELEESFATLFSENQRIGKENEQLREALEEWKRSNDSLEGAVHDKEIELQRHVEAFQEERERSSILERELTILKKEMLKMNHEYEKQGKIANENIDAYKESLREMERQLVDLSSEHEKCVMALESREREVILIKSNAAAEKNVAEQKINSLRLRLGENEFKMLLISLEMDRLHSLIPSNFAGTCKTRKDGNATPMAQSPFHRN